MSEGEAPTTREKLLDAARAQLDRAGAEQLSMRAIARSLELSPGAPYRHVRSREELLTALAAESYRDLAGAMRRAADQKISGRERWVAAWRAAHTWALDYPNRFSLIYGASAIDFSNPEMTTAAALRVPLELARIAKGGRNKALTGPETRALGVDLWRIRMTFGSLDAELGDLPDGLIVSVIRAWTELVGTITLEMTERYAGLFDDHLGYLDTVANQWAGTLQL
ncbi:TetR/AcrR family transcriptional regulator [Actinotignum sp. GS-2025b]|uniref:TetR/AcrR family transcriptional regulator n=1 Tax=Actinotignum sp. GS-2025b TaxID=3427275 RepID=UPI003F4576B8